MNFTFQMEIKTSLNSQLALTRGHRGQIAAHHVSLHESDEDKKLKGEFRMLVECPVSRHQFRGHDNLCTKIT